MIESTGCRLAMACDDSIVPLPEEEAPLREMKQALAEELATEPWASFPELVGDIRLLRFLRGHGTAAAATSAFKAHLAWRQEFGVDAIREAVVEKKMELNWDHYPRGSEVYRFFPMQINGGISRDGHIVQMDNTGMIQPEGILGEGGIGIDAFNHAFIHMLEVRNKLQDDRSRAEGRMVRIVQVRDMEQVGMGMLSSGNMAMAKQVVKLSQENYPESMAKIIFVNAGAVFTAIMATMRGVLAAKTMEKIVSMNTDPETQLLEYVGIDALQRLCRLSGEGREKIAGHPSVSGGGGELSVPARWHADACVAVQPGQTARWSWSTVKYDVGFHADVLSDSVATGWEAVPTGVSESGKAIAAGDLVGEGVRIDGSYAATEPVVLRLRWDNAHAWTTSKTVNYRLVIDGEGGVGPAGDGAAEPEPEPAA